MRNAFINLGVPKDILANLSNASLLTLVFNLEDEYSPILDNSLVV